MHWVEKSLRGKVVYARATEDGELEVLKDGRVEIIYQKKPNAKIYRASARNLATSGDGSVLQLGFDVGSGPEDTAAVAKPATGYGAQTSPPPEDAIVIYTDGACSGNPGPMGIGAVIMDRGRRHEISEYIGTGTNNIAELTAIERALAAIPETDRTRPVHLHTDSSYSIGLLTKDWKAKKNIELVARLRVLVAQFDRLRFVKVKGHAGIPENERADALATGPISNR